MDIHKVRSRERVRRGQRISRFLMYQLCCWEVEQRRRHHRLCGQGHPEMWAWDRLHRGKCHRRLLLLRALRGWEVEQRRRQDGMCGEDRAEVYARGGIHRGHYYRG